MALPQLAEWEVRLTAATDISLAVVLDSFRGQEEERPSPDRLSKDLCQVLRVPKSQGVAGSSVTRTSLTNSVALVLLVLTSHQTV